MITWMLIHRSDHSLPEYSDAIAYPSIAAAKGGFTIERDKAELFIDTMREDAMYAYLYHECDPAETDDPYPDAKITVGNRGGIKVENC